MAKTKKKEPLHVLHDVMEKANIAIEKAGLTTEQRNALKDSDFCGPNRSFPVPDCEHVSSAKAYLNRSKFSKSTKAKILTCINKKAKQFNCYKEDSSLHDGEVTYQKLSASAKKLYRSDIFATTRELVEASLKEPGLDLFSCPNCED